MTRIALILVALIFGLHVQAQKYLLFRSPQLPGTDTVAIYTPSNYPETGKTYPTVYMLHGWSGNYKQWGNITNLQALADKYGFILICPDGFYDSWYLDSPRKRDVKFRSFFFETLMPDMQRMFKIDSSKVFITGLSMGGHGALMLFTHDPGRFLSAGSTSGALNLKHKSLLELGLKNLLGEFSANNDLYEKNSFLYNIKNLEGVDKHLFLDCGTEDFLYITNLKVVNNLRKYKVKTTFISMPGTHNAEYWAKSIKYQFEFFKEQIDLQNAKK
jgi:putative tributyrin esterase